MNNIEKKIYNLVKNNVVVKNIIVNIYQTIFSFKGKIKGDINTQLKVKVYDNTFFGFHDRQSLNDSGLLLSHKESCKFINGMGEATIGYFDIHKEENVFNTIGITKCCNYQQGSLATWYSSDSIIFNDIEESAPVTIIKDINGKQLKKFPFHFFSLSDCKNLVTSIDFIDFGNGLPGYGYSSFESLTNPSFKKEASDFTVHDIVKGREVFRFTAKEAKDKSFNILKNGLEYFSHSSFSPDSKYVYFLFRSSNKMRNTSQLFVLSLDTQKIITLPTNGMVSHLSWLSNDKIVAYCNVIDNGNDGYFIFELNNEITSHCQLNIKDISADGHPHGVLLNDYEFYTDIYPNRERRQKLYKINIRDNICEELLSIYSPLGFRGVERVDFHPRLSSCKKYLTIDSSHSNCRSQIVVFLDE